MKTLIAFYSLSGNTRRIADAIVGAVGGEMLEIKTKKGIPNRGFAKFFWGGKQVVKKETPDLLPLEKNPNNYDLVFLGTPVWAGNFTPAVRSFMAAAKLQNKKIALFCVHGGDDPGQTLVNLKEELAGNEIVGKIDFQMGAIPQEQMANNLIKAAEWAKRIANK